MHGAGRDMKMKTFIIEPINICIETRTYSSEVYVAPMDAAMLLGLYFMWRNHAQLDCCKHQIIFNSDTFHMSYRKSKGLPRVAKVILPSKTALPSNSAVHINGQLTEKLPRNYVIEPQTGIPVFLLRCMYSDQTMSRLCLVNASDRYYTIHKGIVVGEAVEDNLVDLSVEKKKTCYKLL